MGRPGLAGPVGLDAADRLGGGPADGAGVVTAQVDGHGVLGDVDGDDATGGLSPHERAARLSAVATACGAPRKTSVPT
jgi:hypothetical protein